jgi:hypothetical protein
MPQQVLKRILFIMPLPPPVHGSTLMCRQIQQSELINSSFDCSYVNLSTSRNNIEVDRFSLLLLFKKGMRFIGAYVNVFWKLTTHRPDIAYLAITCHGIGFLKDAPFVLLCKLFGCSIVLHQHNKGMAPYVNRSVYRWLLPLVYRKSTVILLSWLLYDDISFVVKREQVKICPNGI